MAKITKTEFQNNINSLNIELSESFFSDIDFYISTLFEWNKVHNLTAFKTFDEVYFNILDSIIPISFNELNFKSLLDIGTGAGFPSLFFSIANKNLDITLVEPNKKRTAFLSFIKSNLKLKNLTVITKKVEDMNSDKKFSLITSRAVTETKILLELSKNRIDEDLENSSYLFYKGSNLENELEKTGDKSKFKNIIIKESSVNLNRKYLILN